MVEAGTLAARISDLENVQELLSAPGGLSSMAYSKFSVLVQSLVDYQDDMPVTLLLQITEKAVQHIFHVLMEEVESAVAAAASTAAAGGGASKRISSKGPASARVTKPEESLKDSKEKKARLSKWSQAIHAHVCFWEKPGRNKPFDVTAPTLSSLFGQLLSVTHPDADSSGPGRAGAPKPDAPQFSSTPACTDLVPATADDVFAAMEMELAGEACRPGR